MAVDGVLSSLKSLQSESKLRERDVIRDEVELGLELHGREAAEDAIISVFSAATRETREPEQATTTSRPHVVSDGGVQWDKGPGQDAHAGGMATTLYAC